MSKARFLFKYPAPGDAMGELIDFGESVTSNTTLTDLPSHAAYVSKLGIYEALYPAVVLSPLNAYDNIRHKIIEIDMPDLEAAEAYAAEQVGKPYSFLSCAEAELYALTGKLINAQQDGTDCSQLDINIGRVGKLAVLGSEPAALIRPSDLFNELIRLGGIVIETTI
jgi:hypothetical protein